MELVQRRARKFALARWCGIAAATICTLALMACGEEAPPSPAPKPTTTDEEAEQLTPGEREFAKAYDRFTPGSLEELVESEDTLSTVSHTLGKKSIQGTGSFSIDTLSTPDHTYQAYFFCKQPEPERVKLTFYHGPQALTYSMTVDACSPSLQALGTADSSTMPLAADKFVVETSPQTTTVVVVVAKEK